MIEPGEGDLLLTAVEALVNPVNTQGVMGKGLALAFKQAYPDNFEAYRRACRAGEVQPGRVFVFERQTPPRYILNVPTKRGFHEPSRLDDVARGLDALVATVTRLGITSLAVPALGCGLGGLSWADVGPLIEAAFATHPGVRVVLFGPRG